MAASAFSFAAGMTARQGTCEPEDSTRQARQYARYLPDARTRENGNHLADLVLRTRLARRVLLAEDVAHGMADELHVKPRAVEERWLERQEAKELREAARDLRDAVLVPCPDLRADKVHGRDATRLRVGVQPEVEPGIVNRHNDVWTPLAYHALHSAAHAEKEEYLPEHRPEPHHREVASLEPLALVAAEDGLSAIRGKRGLEFAPEAVRVDETRLLPGKYEELLHCGGIPAISSPTTCRP